MKSREEIIELWEEALAFFRLPELSPRERWRQLVTPGLRKIALHNGWSITNQEITALLTQARLDALNRDEGYAELTEAAAAYAARRVRECARGVWP